MCFSAQTPSSVDLDDHAGAAKQELLGQNQRYLPSFKQGAAIRALNGGHHHGGTKTGQPKC